MRRPKPITGCNTTKKRKMVTVINLYDENGKRCPKWTNTGLSERGNKHKAEVILNEQLTEYNRNNIPLSRLTVADFFSKWIVDIKTEVRPTTYRNYLGNIQRHIIPYFEKQKILLQDLTANDLEVLQEKG